MGDGKELNKKLNGLLSIQGEVPAYATKHFIKRCVQRFRLKNISELELTLNSCFSNGKLGKMNLRKVDGDVESVLGASHGSLLIVFDKEDSYPTTQIDLITAYLGTSQKLHDEKDSTLSGVYLRQKREAEYMLNDAIKTFKNK